MSELTLYVMSGCPSSGKTELAKKYIWKDGVRYVSRDDIRFRMIGDEAYFSREKEVAREFYQRIAKNLEAGHDVIADATHINVASINKLIQYVKLHLASFNELEIIVVYLDTPVEVCAIQNAKREGKERVPVHVIKEMAEKRSSVKEILDSIPEVEEVYQIQYHYREDD